MCHGQNDYLYKEANSTFGINDEIVDADLYKGGLYLGCAFGMYALYIWAIGILASGQSATMTGTYAGQFAMEGFLNLQWVRWKRVVFTRTIAIIPTFCVAYFSTIQDLTSLNDFLNVIMTLQLPFAVIPLVTFTSNPSIMGEFVNGIAIKVLSILIFVLVLSINFTFVISRFYETEMDWWWIALISEHS